MIDIVVTNGALPPEEIQAYVDKVTKDYGAIPERLEITICGDEVELRTRMPFMPFKRLRRITGYIVGDMSLWNSAKIAEERDRLKHA